MAPLTHIVTERTSPILPDDDMIVAFCRERRDALADACNEGTYVSYPLADGQSICIKFGEYVSDAEAWTQRWLRKRLHRDSVLKIPKVFHSFKADKEVYIVMEEIKGETVHELVMRSPDALDRAAATVGGALQDLIRIAPPESYYVGPFGGGALQCPLFPGLHEQAEYKSNEDLERYINTILRSTQGNRVVDFKDETRIFWLSQIDQHDFKIVGDVVYLLNFQATNIVPECFKVYAIESRLRYIDGYMCNDLLAAMQAQRSSLPYLFSSSSKAIANAEAIAYTSLQLQRTDYRDLDLRHVAEDLGIHVIKDHSGEAWSQS